MTPYDLHLQAAQGFLGLGLPLDADEELDRIEPDLRSLSEVLVVRLEIYQTLGQWELMEAVARRLCELRGDEPRWFVALAFAARRTAGLPESLAILAHASNRFPNEPTILYHLACCAAQLGHLHAARGRIKEAMALAPELRDMALADPDLAPLHEELRDGSD